MSSGAPNEAEMMKQRMEIAKLNENHKMLAIADGTWTFIDTMWMDVDPGEKPEKSRWNAFENRSWAAGTSDGCDWQHENARRRWQNENRTFKGHGMEGYDNVKKKFVGTWMDNMGTGIMMSEGDYDPATKTFTYTSEMEPMPGMKRRFVRF